MIHQRTFVKKACPADEKIERSRKGLDARLRRLEADNLLLHAEIEQSTALQVRILKLLQDLPAPVREAFFPGAHEMQPNGQHFITRKRA